MYRPIYDNIMYRPMHDNITYLARPRHDNTMYNTGLCMIVCCIV